MRKEVVGLKDEGELFGPNIVAAIADFGEELEQLAKVLKLLILNVLEALNPVRI